MLCIYRCIYLYVCVYVCCISMLEIASKNYCAGAQLHPSHCCQHLCDCDFWQWYAAVFAWRIVCMYRTSKSTSVQPPLLFRNDIQKTQTLLCNTSCFWFQNTNMWSTCRNTFCFLWKIKASILPDFLYGNVLSEWMEPLSVLSSASCSDQEEKLQESVFQKLTTTVMSNLLGH